MTRPAVGLPLLTDGLVLLRPADEGDLPAIDRGQRDPDVVRWIGPPWPSEELLGRNEARWAAGSPTLAICELDGSCVGLVWVNVQEADRSTGFVGYWLVGAARGRGMATAAVRLITRWAVTALGLERVYIRIAPENERSQRVAERSGFRRIAASPGDPPGAIVGGDLVFELVEQLSAEGRPVRA